MVLSKDKSENRVSTKNNRLTKEEKEMRGRPPKIKKNNGKAVIPKDLESNVHDAPEFVMAAASRGTMQIEIAKFADTLKAMGNGKCLVFTIDELSERFGKPIQSLKQVSTYIKVNLKTKYGVSKPKTVIDGNRLFIINNSLN